MELPASRYLSTLGAYHSGVPRALSERAQLEAVAGTTLSQAAAQQVAGTFVIKLTTQSYAPNHVVTLRTEVDGWNRDIHGSYYNSAWIDRKWENGAWTNGTWVEGAWYFRLDKERYKAGLVFKFVLDHCHWATGPNLSMPAPDDVEYGESAVQFTTVQPRYRHYYDNLQVSENNLQQLLVHANHDESVKYDLIVVGSGMVGGVLALQAAQLGRKVLILDAGRLEYSSHIFNLPHAHWGGLQAQHGVENYTRGDDTHIGQYPNMNLGGRSVFWYGIIPRMRNWELAFWPPPVASALTGGGYDAAEALMKKHQTTGPFQDQLIANLQTLFPNHEVCDTPRSEHQPNIGQSSFVEQSTGTFSTAELLYDALTAEGPLGRANLFVNLNHLVTRLEKTGSKITGVVCQDLVGNRQRTYRAEAVVLAAGSIETPKIALRSQLANPNSRTGVGLTDHGSFFSTTFEIPASSPYAGNDKYARIFLYADGNASHRFNMEVELNDDYFRVRHANAAYWQNVLSNRHRTTIKLKATCATPLIDTNKVELAANPDDKTIVTMKRTPFGPETRPSVEAMGTQILNFFGVQGFNLSDENQMGFGRDGTPHHAGGTMRMSADGSGVVNTNLRHESYDNLYVCDASVSPFIPAANPSLTLVALALRLANHLHSVLP